MTLEYSYWSGKTLCFPIHIRKANQMLLAFTWKDSSTPLQPCFRVVLNLLLCRSMGPWSSRHIALHEIILYKSSANFCCRKSNRKYLRLCRPYFLGGSDSIEPTCNMGDLGLIPWLGRFPGGGYGNPLQYSCLVNPMDREDWQVQSIRLQNQTWLSD